MYSRSTKRKVRYQLTPTLLSLARQILLSILSHPLLHPLATLRSMPIHLLLIRQQLLHAIRIRNIGALAHRGTRPHPIFPGLESGEILDADTGPPGGADPSPVRDIGDGAFVADQVFGFGVAEMGVEDAV